LTIQLKYPKTGDSRSAFVVANIDDEPGNEAIVFYEKLNSTENQSTIRINVLDQIDGKWQSVYDLHGSGTEIDKILISNLGNDKKTSVIIGFNMASKDEKELQVFNYKDKKLNLTYSDSYSIMDIIDLDLDGESELLTITNSLASGIETAKLFKSVDGNMVDTSDTQMENGGVISYSGFVKGLILEDCPALFVDVLKENGILQTEVFYYRYGELKNSTHNNFADLLKQTTRPVGYPCVDVDKDGIVEIPVTSVFWGYEGNAEKPMLLTNWYAFKDFSTLVNKHQSFYNQNDAYVFMIPSRWTVKVTVKEDTTTDEIVFYQYDGQMSENMTELMRFSVTPKKDGEEMLKNGYSLITSKGQIDYWVKLGKATADGLVLTMAEVLNNFYVLQ